MMTVASLRTPLAACLVAGLVIGLAGCAGKRLHREGMDLFATGHYEAGLAKLESASRAAPRNAVYRMAYQNARKRLVLRTLAEAQAEQRTGRFETAARLFQHAERLDAESPEVREAVAAFERAKRQRGQIDAARRLIAEGKGMAALASLDAVLEEDPGQAEALALRRQLDTASGRDDSLFPALAAALKKPVRLEFRDAGLKQVLEALSFYGGLNFVLDREVPDSIRVTVFLRDISLADATDLILTTHQLRRRVLNENTLLVYPDTAAKQSEHQELVVKHVFLANASARQAETMLKTVLKMRNVFSDERLNLLIMRDTPATIRLADRLLAAEDVNEPEVMLEVAIAEVSRSSLLNLGIKYPNQLTLTPLPSGETLTLRELLDLNASRVGAAISPLVLNLQDDDSITNLLANPRIRARNREKATIRIGDRVPVITTTATSTGFVSENVQYADVGLTLEVEPTIYPGDEVAIRLNLEVSSVVKEVVSKAGTVSYQLGSRNASTVIRLKNGETQVLGGLINDEDRRSAARFPGLSRLPLIGRLFSSNSDNTLKSELVLSITPRVIHSLAPPPSVPGEFWSGTENTPGLREGRP